MRGRVLLHEAVGARLPAEPTRARREQRAVLHEQGDSLPRYRELYRAAVYRRLQRFEGKCPFLLLAT